MRFHHNHNYHHHKVEHTFPEENLVRCIEALLSSFMLGQDLMRSSFAALGWRWQLNLLVNLHWRKTVVDVFSTFLLLFLLFLPFLLFYLFNFFYLFYFFSFVALGWYWQYLLVTLHWRKNVVGVFFSIRKVTLHDGEGASLLFAAKVMTLSLFDHMAPPPHSCACHIES